MKFKPKNKSCLTLQEKTQLFWQISSSYNNRLSLKERVTVGDAITALKSLELGRKKINRLSGDLLDEIIYRKEPSDNLSSVAGWDPSGGNAA